MTIKSDLLKHKILVNRYAKGQANILIKEMNQLRNEIIKEVNRFDRLSYPQIQSLENRMLSGTPEIVRNQVNQLNNYYNYEAKFSSKVFKKYKKLKSLELPTVTKLDIQNVEIPFSLFKEPKSVIESYESFTQIKIRQAARILKDTEALSLSKQETLDKLYHLFGGLVRTQSNVLTLNTVNAVMQKVREDLIKINNISYEQVQWVNDLDSNVCDYCEGLDQEIFPIDDHPDYPAHGNCNCELIPV